VAAMKSDRNSIGVEIIPKYARMAAHRLQQENQDLFSNRKLQFLIAEQAEDSDLVTVREDEELYRVKRRRKSSFRS